MTRVEELLREHFPHRLRHGEGIAHITPAVPLFVFIGALLIDYLTLESKVRELEGAVPHEDVSEALERWVLETTETNIIELACFEYTHWHDEIKANQVFMASVDDSILLGVHTEETSPAWLIDGVASSHADIAKYMAGLQMPPDGLLRVVNAQPSILTSEELDSAICAR